ncbi:MAG: CHAT domain-containing protein [Candidatus Hodarchaeota archaeon]
MVNFEFQLIKKDGSYFVHLSVDGLDSCDGKFEFDLDPLSRISQVIRDIESNNCQKDDLKDIGSQLWVGLVENETSELFKQKRVDAERSEAQIQFRLNLPPELESLPWETLYDETDAGFLVINPKYCIMRSPPSNIQVQFKKDVEPELLRILVIIPEGSGLQVEHEWQNIQNVAEWFENKARVERLEGRATPDRIMDELRYKPWDIMHFIGHGMVDDDGRIAVRLNSEDHKNKEQWLDADTFAEMFRESQVRLVVLNCCLGATPNPSSTLSGLGPYLQRAGVPCVVAMRYEIPDDVAIKFSNEFYHHLLSGSEPGRVDFAIQRARRSLYMNSTQSKIRCFVTPVLYLAKDHEKLFELQGTAPKPLPLKPSTAPIPKNVPKELVDAFQEGRCIPVIGPSVVRAGTVRKGLPALDPGQIAEQLAHEVCYPRDEDIEICKCAGEWMKTILFQCVCQHYQYVKKRFQLVRSIKRAYECAEPPQSLLNIALWNVPGIIYTFIDGLMEKALNRQDKLMCAISDLTEKVDADINTPLLVLLRGSVKNLESLVLTEEDHDLLCNNIRKLSTSIAGLTRGELGRSLLFLGVSPRDPIIRLLSAQLLETGSSRNQGPTFFVGSGHTDADHSYWEKFDVQWIEEDLNDLISALSNIVQGGKP